MAAHMLASLTAGSVRLLTNNPKKIAELERFGIRVNGRVPRVIPANEHNRFYLQTTATRSRHLIDVSGQPHASSRASVRASAPR